jgi:tyrosyl-tRNA synthetase
LAASKGEARRLIDQGGVRINGEKASNAAAEITIGSEPTLIQVGKRKFLKVRD